MKLLFDHNLSHKLVPLLEDVFPGSSQTGLLHMGRASDEFIWTYAESHNFAIVTQDKDFADLALIRGHPPKVIWLRCGNLRVAEMVHLIRANAGDILEFGKSSKHAVLEIWPTR